MKAVMMSIRPKMCQKIAIGEKTIEVRRTKPNLDPPFKCYIYCTKPKNSFTHGGIREYTDELYRLPNGEIRFGYSGELMLYPDQYTEDNFLNGKVVMEFVCDKLVWVVAHPDIFAGHPVFYTKAIEDACLTRAEVEEYSNGKDLYGWHISELKIYDKPKNIRQFTRYSEKDMRPCVVKRFTCHHEHYDFNEGTTICNIDYDGSHCPFIRLQKPPQSWCYVEELEET